MQDCSERHRSIGLNHAPSTREKNRHRAPSSRETNFTFNSLNTKKLHSPVTKGLRDFMFSLHPRSPSSRQPHSPLQSAFPQLRIRIGRHFAAFLPVRAALLAGRGRLRASAARHPRRATLPPTLPAAGRQDRRASVATPPHQAAVTATHEQ